MSPQKLAARRATDRVKRARRRLSLFAAEDAAATPSALRRPHTRSQWLALTEEERFEHLRSGMHKNEYARCLTDVLQNPPARVLAYLELSQGDKAAVEAGTYVPPADPAPVPVPETVPATAARYSLPCSTCGEYVPVSSPRARRAKCPEHTK